jgi:signal transduction histidine kinase/DNA-binding response OmpR family regulator
MLSAPWRTWWAFLLYSIIIAGALFGLISVIQVQESLKRKLALEQQAYEHQQEINEHKLQFFTNISHEFRTPLTLILGPLEQIINEYRGSSKVFKNLKTIQKNADHLYRLISELMIFRKLENKQMKLKVQAADIISFLYEIYLSFEPQAKLHKYTYTFDTTEKLLYVLIDKDKLERVFFNLLSNAFKYTSAGGKIRMLISRKDDEVKIRVQDDGCGISREHIDLIFDRFYEVRNASEHGNYHQGTGIGLTIARNLTELHHGSIGVESAPNQGSCFTVTLPIIEKGVREQPKETEQFEPALSPFLQQAEFYDGSLITLPTDVLQNPLAVRILVVEDDPSMSDFLNEVLSSVYRVECKKNGAEAFDYAVVHQPELIISDVMMPVMDGIELCQKIKANIETSHIPFIMLTARASVLHKFDGLESGADEYLSKPFVVKELLLKCHNILKTRQNLKATFEKSGEISLPVKIMTSMDEELMTKAMEIVQQNLSNEHFDILEFCEQLGVSRTVLFTKIKSWTRLTPNDFIITLRMKKAAELIERRVGSISQVAYKVGFKDPKYFSRCFNKRYGMSPKEYNSRFKV